MSSQIDRLRDHVIVCGFGRIRVMLAQGLRDGGVDFLILEQSEPRSPWLGVSAICACRRTRRMRPRWAPLGSIMRAP
jgi:hypothetical protein